MPVLTPDERKTVTLTQDEAANAVRALSRGERLTFQSLKNRNWVANLARGEFIDVVRYTHKNQLYDPRYTVEGWDIPDKGLGNDYKHFFASIYCLELDNKYPWLR